MPQLAMQPDDQPYIADIAALGNKAPRHLFPDADDWPTSYLCRKCHHEWHRKVTPLMTRTAA